MVRKVKKAGGGEKKHALFKMWAWCYKEGNLRRQLIVRVYVEKERECADLFGCVRVVILIVGAQ